MTSGDADNTAVDPALGSAIEQLVRLSYESEVVARDLAAHLAPSAAEGRLKTLKAVHQMVLRGSRLFRRELRRRDEYLAKAAKSGGNVKNAEAVRRLAVEVRNVLHDDELRERDESEEVEERPGSRSNLSGLGSSGKGQGKYDGFGNAPINRGNEKIHLILFAFYKKVSFFLSRRKYR